MMQKMVQALRGPAQDKMAIRLSQHHHNLRSNHFTRHNRSFVTENPIRMKTPKPVRRTRQSHKLSTQRLLQPNSRTSRTRMLNHLPHKRIRLNRMITIIKHNHALTLSTRNNQTLNLRPSKNKPQILPAKNQRLTPTTTTNRNLLQTHIPQKPLMIRSSNKPLITTHQNRKKHRILNQPTRNPLITQNLPQRPWTSNQHLRNRRYKTQVT